MKICQPKKEKITYTGIIIVMFYCFDLIHLLLMQITPTNSLAKTIATMFLYVYLLFIMSKKRNIIKIDAVILIFLNGMLFLFSYIFHPEYRYAMFEMPTWNIFSSVFSLSSGMFAYMFFRMESSPSKLRKYLKYSAYLLLFWSLLRIKSSISNGGFTRVFENGVISKNTYDMAVGYRLLFVSIIFMLEAIKKEYRYRKFWFIFLSFVSTILMFVFGSRSAFISLIIFWTLYYFFYKNETNNIKSIIKKISWTIFFLITSSILASEKILVITSNILEKVGLKSRMLNSLIEGNITLDSGRNRLWAMAIEMIQENPILGAGVYADRAKGGIYCHQIILEILLDFGMIFGTMIILYMIIMSTKMLLKCWNKEWKLLFLIFFSLTIIRLNISSSFWYDTNFWICIAIVVNYHKGERNMKGLSEFDGTK